MSEDPPPRPGRPVAADPRLVLGLLALGGYALAARGVQNLYPFSVFPMYAGKAGTTTSRVMARTANGAFVEVTAFDRWHCESLPTLEATTCEGVGGIPYIDREREDYIRAHPSGGAAGEPLELVRRVFSFADGSRPSHCAITRCTAVRR